MQDKIGLGVVRILVSWITDSWNNSLGMHQVWYAISVLFCFLRVLFIPGIHLISKCIPDTTWD